MPSDDILTPNFSAPSQPSQQAPFAIPSAPQPFGFAGKTLVGVLTGWSGAQERRHVVFVFPKRAGQRVEDFERAGQWIQVRLRFIGDTAAQDAQNFKYYVDQNPSGRLDHPIAGQWQAFCLGPTETVDFARALNLIEMDVRFIEDELDARIPVETPDVGTASQNVSLQKTAYQQTVAAVLGAYGKAQTQSAAALASIDAALNAITSVAAPVATMQAIINTALGAASKVAGTINDIASLTDVLNADVDAFTTTAIDLFTGSDVAPVAQIEAVSSTLATVQADAQALEDVLTTSANPSLLAIGGNANAASAPAIGDIELLIDTCLTLNDALLAQLPPIASYTVPATVSIIVLSQRLMNLFGISGRAPEAYASVILSLNRIPAPQAISAGTTLDVPTA